MLRIPVSGSFVITSGNVMYGPPSSGQHFRIGNSSSVPSFVTTSWHAASRTVFGMRSARRVTIGAILMTSIMPVGGLGSVSSLISSTISSSDSTPSARHIRSFEPNRFVATGIEYPVGFSNSKPGPPCGDFEARSVTAQISRSGLTSSATRRNQPRLSRAEMNSSRSRCIARLSNRSVRLTRRPWPRRENPTRHAVRPTPRRSAEPGPRLADRHAHPPPAGRPFELH